MSGARHFNLARVTTATVGTGTVTLGSAVSGFLTFANAGVVDGATVTYAIKEGSNSEIGRGVYSSSGPTLTRATILESTNSGSAITLAGAAEVFLTPAAEDFLSAVNPQTGTTYTVLDTDIGKTVTLTNAAAIAVTLPQATGLFGAGWSCFIVNIGSTTATITPTTSTINGAATLTLNRGQGIYIVSDGTNWQVFQGTGIKGATTTVASATTADIGAIASDRVSITGTTTITSLGSVPNLVRFVSFTGILTLTHNATSLILPGGANITTAAGDCAIFSSDSSGNWRCLVYSKSSGTPVVSSANSISQLNTSATVTDTGSDGQFSVTTDGTEVFRVATGGNFSAVIPSGSTLIPAFLCRAWVNLNGTGTPAIRGSGNVTSITDNGTGDYTINFTTAMPDENYSVVANCMKNEAAGGNGIFAVIYPSTTYSTAITTTAVRIRCIDYTGAAPVDPLAITAGIFR
jgi:hypothetical protein